MKYSILAGIMASLCLFGCHSRSNEQSEIQGINKPHEYLEVVSRDSFLIDKNSGQFYDRIPQLDRALYLKNRLFLLGRSGVRVGLVDTLGSFIQNITQAGDGPGDLIAARSAKAWQNEQGEIYILTNGNVFSLYVYDRYGNFRYTIRLFNELQESYHPREGAFHISEKEKGVFTLTLSIGSTRSSSFRKRFYEESSSIAKLVINDDDGQVIASNTFRPYRDLPEIKKALLSEQICWGLSAARFQFQQDLIYLTYPFSREIYVLDNDFDLVQTIRPKTLRQYKDGFCFSMQAPPEDLYDRTYLEHRAYFENLHIKHLQVLDHLLVLQFEAPMEESDYLHKFPTKKEAEDPANYQQFFQKRDQYWLIYNLISHEEELIRLSSDHRQGILLDPNRLLVEKVTDENEERYLLKYVLGR